MNFLRQLFADPFCSSSLAIMGFLLGAFLIGWIARYFASSRRIRNSEESLERSRLELKQSKKLREGLQEKFDLKEADYQKASLALVDRSKVISTLEKDKNQLNSRLTSTLDEHDKAKAEHTQTASRLEEMNDQILGLRTKNSQLNAELQQRTATINQYADTTIDTSRQEELEAVIAQLRSDNAALKSASTVSSATTQNYEGLEQKLAQLEAEKDKWNESLAEITQLEEGNSALNSSMMQLIEQNELLKDQVEQLAQYESGNDILNTTILQLMEENEVLKAKKISTSSAATTVIRQVPKAAAIPIAAAATSAAVEGDLTTDQAKADIKSAIGKTIKYATPAEKDDLKKIQGIGPFIEEKLNDLGIYTYEQVSQLEEDMIPTLTTAIEFFPSRIERDEWVGQADRLFYMKGNRGGTGTTTSRRVISRTVVTRPKEESFLSEKKAVQEKIIVDTPASKKITRVIRRDPITRVERVVRREPVKRTDTPPPTEKVDLPTPPKAQSTPVVKEEVVLEKPIPTPAASPGLKESISRKIVFPPVVPPPAMEETTEVIPTEEVAPEVVEDTSAAEDLFEEETMVVEETATEEEQTEEDTNQTETEEAVKEEETESTTEEEESNAANDSEEEATPIVPAEPVVPDDLKKIEGIGPKISTVLNNAGILTYSQLAATSYDKLQDIIDDAGPRFRIARPKYWPDQAAMAAHGRWDDLKAYQNRLRGGTLFPE